MKDLSLEAAKYLIKVSEDDKLYASYFWWRDFYTTARNDWAEVWSRHKIVRSFSDFFLFQTMCSLCSALHNNSAPTNVIPDMVQWWKTEAKCSSNILSSSGSGQALSQALSDSLWLSLALSGPLRLSQALTL